MGEGGGLHPENFSEKWSIPAWEIPWAALVGYNPRGRKRNRHDLAIKQQMFVAVLSMSRECMFFDFLSRHNKDLE